jgi:hypothetical protein
MDDHDYWEDEIHLREIEEMRATCPGCQFWDDYYLCTAGKCIYEP